MVFSGIERHLKYHGQDATVTNFSETGTDEYGDPQYSESTETAQVVVTRPPMGNFNTTHKEFAQDVKQNATIYLSDSVTVTDGEDGEAPTEITVDGVDYEVIVVDDQQSGLVRVFVQRI